MEAIIYNTRPQQEALENRLTNHLKNNDAVPQAIRDAVTDYTFCMDHPTNGKVAVIIERYGYYWKYIETELTAAEINNIITLTDDWYPVIEEAE